MTTSNDNILICSKCNSILLNAPKFESNQYSVICQDCGNRQIYKGAIRIFTNSTTEQNELPEIVNNYRYDKAILGDKFIWDQHLYSFDDIKPTKQTKAAKKLEGGDTLNESQPQVEQPKEESHTSNTTNSVDVSMIERFATPNLYQDTQFKHLTEHEPELVVTLMKIVNGKLPHEKSKEIAKVKRLISKIDTTKPDCEIYAEIKKLVSPWVHMSEKAYNGADHEYLMKRAQSRAEDFKSILTLKQTKGKAMCDIGANDGYISRHIMKLFKFKSLDMYDPFMEDRSASVEELPQDNVVYHKQAFETQPEKYDFIFLITTLHHVTNADELLKSIFDSLKHGGHLVIREHSPQSNEDRVYLDLYDKMFSFALTNELECSTEKLAEDNRLIHSDSHEFKFYAPSAYFSNEQLIEYVTKYGFTVGKQHKLEFKPLMDPILIEFIKP